MLVCTDLRDSILQLLDGMIGTYLYSDGYSESAIAIIPDQNHGYEVPGNGTRTEGIEVIIVRPVPQVSHFLTGRQLKSQWNIVLKQWDASQSLIEAATILVEKLDYLLTSPKLVPPNNALGIIEQCSFTVIDYEYQSG